MPSAQKGSPPCALAPAKAELRFPVAGFTKTKSDLIRRQTRQQVMLAGDPFPAKGALAGACGHDEQRNGDQDDATDDEPPFQLRPEIVLVTFRQALLQGLLGGVVRLAVPNEQTVDGGPRLHRVVVFAGVDEGVEQIKRLQFSAEVLNLLLDVVDVHFLQDASSRLGIHDSVGDHLAGHVQGRTNVAVGLDVLLSFLVQGVRRGVLLHTVQDHVPGDQLRLFLLAADKRRREFLRRLPNEPLNKVLAHNGTDTHCDKDGHEANVPLHDHRSRSGQADCRSPHSSQHRRSCAA